MWQWIWSLCVLSLNQVLYSALDLLRVCVKVRKQLFRGLRYELLVGETSSHLHNADNGRINLERTIHLNHLQAERWAIGDSALGGR